MTHCVYNINDISKLTKGSYYAYFQNETKIYSCRKSHTSRSFSMAGKFRTLTMRLV